MIYRGELYYGPEKKTVFVIYGSEDYVSKAMWIVSEYCDTSNEYPHPTCSINPLLYYWWWQITDPIRNLISEIQAPDGVYNEDLNSFQRIAYWWKYKRSHNKDVEKN